MSLYQNKYKVESARMPGWDYGNDAWYFITICTHNRVHYFGQIDNKIMEYSDIGIIAHTFWERISEFHPYVILDAFTIMPNHVHGIIRITKHDTRSNNAHGVETPHLASHENHHVRTHPVYGETRGVASLQDGHVGTNGYKNTFGPQSKNIASIIRGYKSAVTRDARKHNAHFRWQPRFYDSIIRNERAVCAVRQYILNNVSKWGRNRNNRIGLWM